VSIIVRSSRRFLCGGMIAVCVGLVAVSVMSGWGGLSGARGAQIDIRRVVVSVGGLSATHAIRAGFAGLSLEYTAVVAYAGKDPSAVDPVFEQLVRNIAAGQRPVLRIGGDTTDWTWWPVPGMTRPPWVRYTLNDRWLGVMRAVSRAVHARLIPGINLEANSRRVAAAEARALLSGLGRSSIEAFELGNEPELFSHFSWYRTPAGRHVRGRRRGYDFAAFARDFSKLAAALPARIPVAGPGTGGGPAWTDPLPGFLHREPHLRVVTMHRYGLNGCSHLVAIAALISEEAQRGLAMSVETPTRIAHAHHIPLRVEEMNTVACDGQAGVSNTFAAALWLLDTLFEAARVGVDGVNVHTNPADPGRSTAPLRALGRLGFHRKSSGLNSLFDFQLVGDRWRASVRPEYYGMMMFAQAAPAGARLLATSQSPGTDTLHPWATRARDGTIRVVLINESRGHRVMVTVRIPAVRGPATLERLSAPRLSATSGTTLGGHGFGTSTATGNLPAPIRIAVTPGHGEYTVTLPAASAAMLTFAKPHRVRS